MSDLQQYLIIDALGVSTGFITPMQEAEDLISLLFRQQLTYPFQTLKSVKLLEGTSRSEKVQVLIEYQEDADLEGGGYTDEEVWYLQGLKTLTHLEER